MKKKDKKKNKKIDNSNEIVEVKEEPVKQQKVIAEKPEEPVKKTDNTIKKEKKENVIVKKFNMYKFIVKIFAFALLVTFGILILVFQQQAVFAIFLVTAIVVLLGALIRVVPLIKTLKKTKSKIISMVEISIHILIGLYLIFAAFNYIAQTPDEDGNFTGIARFNEIMYPYILTIILYTRCFAYFWITILHEEKTDKFKFWVHMICISIAILLAALGHFLGIREIVITLAVIAIICALVIGGEAGTGYYRYRKQISEPKRKEKEKEKSKKAEIEAPGKDDDVDYRDIDPNIIPVNDNQQDSTIIS